MAPWNPLNHARRETAFTLVELLVVIAVVLAMTALIGPALNALKGANDLTTAASDISGLVQFCRSYAIANNTYVYLGIGEFDVSQNDSAIPQTAGIGRVALVAVASKDGTRGYSPYAAKMSEVASSWIGTTTNGAKFTPISKLQRYDNLHISDYGAPPPVSGNMARPDLSGSNFLRLGHPDSNTVTPITYPLGPNPKYTFSKTLQFDPDGLVRIAPKNPPADSGTPPVAYSAQGVPPWLELALVQTHGNTAPSVPVQTSGNHICLMIDGMKGTVTTYRP